MLFLCVIKVHLAELIVIICQSSSVDKRRGGGGTFWSLYSRYVEYGVVGQMKKLCMVPGWMAMSPQDMMFLGQQLVDEVGNLTTQTIQSGMYIVATNFVVFVDCVPSVFFSVIRIRCVLLVSWFLLSARLLL